jgi:hypothetical protein
MSIVIDQTKEKIKQLEDRLVAAKFDGNTDQWYGIPAIEKSLEAQRRKLDILEKSNLEKITADMKIIMSHTNAVDEKYNCRSVKMMFAIADFLDKPRHVSKSLAKWIREYTINKINAPVCSIVASPKPELEPMPGYMDPIANEMEAFRKAQREELLKFRAIWVDYAEHKPTRMERIKERIRVKVNKVLA